MRSYIHTCSALVFLGLVTTPSWAQLRLPDPGNGFLEDIKRQAAASEETDNKKKLEADHGKNADAAAKAIDVAGSSAVEFAGERVGDAATNLQASKGFERSGKARETAASVDKVVSAGERGEFTSEAANQIAEKGVSVVGKLIGGELGEKVIGASYAGTKALLEDTKVGQRIDKFRDETYLGIAGAYDAKPRTGPAGPEAYEAAKIERSMKNAGIVGTSENVPAFSGLNTGPDQRTMAATNARIGSTTGSGINVNMSKTMRNAGLDTGSSPPSKVVINTETVNKLLGPGSTASKSAANDPSAWQASLDNHVDVWTKRKAEEAAELAYEAKVREEERREKAKHDAELDDWIRNRNQAIHDRVVARREAVDQAYRDQQQTIANSYEQRVAIAAAQMQALQNAQQSGYSPNSGTSSVTDSGSTWYGGSKSGCAIDGGMGVRRCSADELKNGATESHTDTATPKKDQSEAASPSTATTSSSSTTSTSPPP